MLYLPSMVVLVVVVVWVLVVLVMIVRRAHLVVHLLLLPVHPVRLGRTSAPHSRRRLALYQPSSPRAPRVPRKVRLCVGTCAAAARHSLRAARGAGARRLQRTNRCRTGAWMQLSRGPGPSGVASGGGGGVRCSGHAAARCRPSVWGHIRPFKVRWMVHAVSLVVLVVHGVVVRLSVWVRRVLVMLVVVW